MEPVSNRIFVRIFRALSLLAGTLFLYGLVTIVHDAHAEPSERPANNNIRTVNQAFEPGERLEYEISWSNLLDAGVVVMEVGTAKTPDGRNAYQFTTNARSKGIVSAFYHVNDMVTSIVDEESLSSISYRFDQQHGRKVKLRTHSLDQDGRSVTYVNNGIPEVHEVPSRVQDALSSLYYLRTRDDIRPGVPVMIDVFDSGKNWSVEVRILGKERIKTELGEFDTIKVSTYPKYEGVFQHKGEIVMWLTDDARKVPVLMRSKISIGSIVGTLVSNRSGGSTQ